MSNKDWENGYDYGVFIGALGMLATCAFLYILIG